MSTAQTIPAHSLPSAAEARARFIQNAAAFRSQFPNPDLPELLAIDQLESSVARIHELEQIQTTHLHPADRSDLRRQLNDAKRDFWRAISWLQRRSDLRKRHNEQRAERAARAAARTQSPPSDAQRITQFKTNAEYQTIASLPQTTTNTIPQVPEKTQLTSPIPQQPATPHQAPTHPTRKIPAEVRRQLQNA